MEAVSLSKYKGQSYELSRQISVGKDLHQIEFARSVKSDPAENKHRRTIILVKRSDNWGFTLQTYGINHQKRKELELMTYVDYVEINGPAHQAGMRAGDVILSINNCDMIKVDHDALVHFIKTQCDRTMRMVVMFQDCCRKVNLHLKYIKLKAVLRDKVNEFRALQETEKRFKALHSIQRESDTSSLVDSSLNTTMTDEEDNDNDNDNDNEDSFSRCSSTVQYCAFTTPNTGPNNTKYKTSAMEGKIVHVRDSSYFSKDEGRIADDSSSDIGGSNPDIEGSNNITTRATCLPVKNSPYIGGRIVRPNLVCGDKTSSVLSDGSFTDCTLLSEVNFKINNSDDEDLACIQQKMSQSVSFDFNKSKSGPSTNQKQHNDTNILNNFQISTDSQSKVTPSYDFPNDNNNDSGDSNDEYCYDDNEVTHL